MGCQCVTNIRSINNNPTMPSTLYILYNADASILGKLHYGYRKLTAPKDKPACAACDITHGGLHLDETAAWKEAKTEIIKGGDVEVKQMHRDEMTGEVGGSQLRWEGKGLLTLQ